MPGFDKSVLTDVGWDALTDAEAGQHIEYTHLEAGDGFVYGGDAEIFGMTDLVNKVMDFPITNFSNDGQGQITLIGVISSKNVTAGFNFREIGVRCTIDGGPSILYAVANAGDEADYIPSSAESGVVIQTVQIIIKIDRAENVTVIVQPGLDVTAQNIGEPTVGPGWFRDKIGNILWFKRLLSPRKTIELSETTDTVSIDLPDITENLDMYVAIGNPDIFPNFSTIQKALDYIRPRRITNQIYVKINVSAGVWTNSAQIVIDHPQGVQIQIIGTAGPILTGTTQSKDGSNNVTINAAAGTFSNINVGDYILVECTNNYIGMGTSGIWKVSARGGTGASITYFCHHWGTLQSQGGVTGTKVMHIKSVIEFATNTSGVRIEEGGLDLLQNIACVGKSNGGYNGLVSYGRLNLITYCGFRNWGPQSDASAGNQGVGLYPAGGGTIYCSHVSCSICHDAFWAGNSGAYLNLKICFATGHWRFGLYSEGGDLHMDVGVACGGHSSGIVINGGSSCVANNCYGIGNVANGLSVSNNSHVACSPIKGGTYVLNGATDIRITTISSATRNGQAIQYNTSNIAPNVLSYDGCYFSP